LVFKQLFTFYKARCSIKAILMSVCLLSVLMLSVIYAEYHLCWVSFMLSVTIRAILMSVCMLSVNVLSVIALCVIMRSLIYALCCLCWVPQLRPVRWVSFGRDSFYAESHNLGHFGECHHAECHSAEWTRVILEPNKAITYSEIYREFSIKLF